MVFFVSSWVSTLFQMLNFEAIWFNTLLRLPELFGRPFFHFLTVSCLVELRMKAEPKLKPFLVHMWVHFRFQCILSACLFSLLSPLFYAFHCQLTLLLA